jgi:hypothetical protein
MVLGAMLSYLDNIDAASIQWVNDTLDAEPDICRTQLVERFCEHFGWRSASGRLNKAGCATALRRLEGYGLIHLPKARYLPCNDPARRRSLEPYPARSELRCRLGELGDIELVPVNGNREGWRLWQRMVNTWHPLHNSRLCGARVCYLIRSETEGLLGAMSFSSAAWRLDARDKWVGWSDRIRAQNLTKVVNNSRFLILPQVHVPHLASHVLAKACRQVVADWERLYGIRPVLLETFVDPRHYRGTCYLAAGWQYIGKTSGRGRQDTGDATGVKTIFCLPLQDDFRRHLGGKAAEYQDWVEEEFDQLELCDKRLKQRLLRITRDFYANPLANIPQASGSRAAAKATYRFFQHPATKLENTLPGHYEATARRIREHKGVILAVQDTTSINYGTHSSTSGLGPIDAKGTMGIEVHDTMAFTEDGVPLGLIDVQYWARKEKKKRTVSESVKWLKGLEAANRVQDQCPRATIISVGDREADFYDLFAAVQPQGAQLLVRAHHSRSLVDSELNLWIHMQRRPVAGTLTIQIPPRKDRKSRTADLAVSFDKVELKQPAGKADMELVTMWAVLARETEPPADGEALEWLLLTTVAVDDFESACRRIEWYTRRWGIEVFHRTLKSGCKIEKRQLTTIDRLGSCLAIDMVVAWRVYYLTMLGRETPDLPCSVFFAEAEWKALTAHAARKPEPAVEPPSLYEAIVMVARLGGYIENSRKKPPGTTNMWRGLVALGWITDAWLAFGEKHEPQKKPPD